MANELNRLWGTKKEVIFCTNCGKETKHKWGVAWNYDTHEYYLIYLCACKKEKRTRLTHERFKELQESIQREQKKKP